MGARPDRHPNWVLERTIVVSARTCRTCGRVLNLVSPAKGKTAFLACTHCDIPCERPKCATCHQKEKP